MKSVPTNPVIETLTASEIIFDDMLIQVVDGSSMPTGSFYILIGNTESIFVTSRAGNTLTVGRRGVFESTAFNHPIFSSVAINEWTDNTITPAITRIPVGTTASRPSVPQDGMIRTNTTTNEIEGYVNSAWRSLSTGGAGGGNAWSDPVNSNIIPDADGTRDLGTTLVRFLNVFTDALIVTGNITIGGTVDGRDVATDGTKLDAIESSATADQTNSEIKIAYEANANTNEFSDTEQTKLAGIATGANNYVHPNHSGDVTSVADGVQTIVNDAVTNAKAANMATATIKGRVTAATGDPEDLSSSQAYSILKAVIPESIIIAVSDETTNLTVGTGKIEFTMPYAMTVSEVSASLTTAPVGATLIVDINDNGASIMATNKLDILTTAKIDDGTATITDTALAKNAVITIDIDQVGSPTAGAGLKVILNGVRT